MVLIDWGVGCGCYTEWSRYCRLLATAVDGYSFYTVGILCVELLEYILLVCFAGLAWMVLNNCCFFFALQYLSCRCCSYLFMYLANPTYYYILYFC